MCQCANDCALRTTFIVKNNQIDKQNESTTSERQWFVRYAKFLW